MATEYQVPDNSGRDCSFLTLARLPLKNDPNRGQMKVAETGWCRSNGSGQSDYTSTSPSDICHGGGSKQSDYTCVQAFIKNSVEAKSAERTQSTFRKACGHACAGRAFRKSGTPRTVPVRLVRGFQRHRATGESGRTGPPDHAGPSGFGSGSRRAAPAGLRARNRNRFAQSDPRANPLLGPSPIHAVRALIAVPTRDAAATDFVGEESRRAPENSEQRSCDSCDSVFLAHGRVGSVGWVGGCPIESYLNMVNVGGTNITKSTTVRRRAKDEHWLISPLHPPAVPFSAECGNHPCLTLGVTASGICSCRPSLVQAECMLPYFLERLPHGAQFYNCSLRGGLGG